MDLGGSKRQSWDAFTSADGSLPCPTTVCKPEDAGLRRVDASSALYVYDRDLHDHDAHTAFGFSLAQAFHAWGSEDG